MTVAASTIAASVARQRDAQVYQASVTLTNNQIKALPTTRVLVIPAQGENRIIVPVSWCWLMNTEAGQYTNNANTDGATLTLESGSAYYTPSVWIDTSLTNARKSFGWGPIGGTQITNFAGNPNYVVSYYTTQQSLIENVGLFIADSFVGVSDYTGGASANTLKVWVSYQVLDTSIGAFV